MKLSPLARREIRAAGLTIAGYVRHWWPDGKWHGDSCGCPDDRCRDFHHEPDEDCGCLPVAMDMARSGFCGQETEAVS